MGPDNICKKEHISPRQLYRHLDLVYMNPNKTNEILSGTTSVKINNLFQIAKTFLIQDNTQVIIRFNVLLSSEKFSRKSRL